MFSYLFTEKDGSNDVYETLKEYKLSYPVEYESLLEHAVDYVDKEGYTPLHSAARETNKEIVADLLNGGADPNAQTKDGTTPLMLSIIYDSFSAFDELLCQGNDIYIDLEDKEGLMAVHYADSCETACKYGREMKEILDEMMKGKDYFSALKSMHERAREAERIAMEEERRAMRRAIRKAKRDNRKLERRLKQLEKTD